MSEIIQRTIIDQIELTRGGTVQLRLARQVVVNDTVLTSEYHRAALEPGTDLEAAIPVIHDHLRQLGSAEVDPQEWDRLRRLIQLEHTPAVVAAFAANKQAAGERAMRELGMESQPA
jgi:hypothetical protein